MLALVNLVKAHLRPFSAGDRCAPVRFLLFVWERSLAFAFASLPAAVLAPDVSQN